MPGLLTAEHAALAPERLQDVAVADVGGERPGCRVAPSARGSRDSSCGHADEFDAEVERQHGDDPVAVDVLAALVDAGDPVAVTVEGDPELGAACEHGLGAAARCRRRRSRC